MKRFILLLTAIFLIQLLSAQSSSAPKVGWYVSPEYSTLLHQDHIGHAVGFQTGVRILKNRLQVGFFYYGRSGPINGQTFSLDLPDGETYKGQSTIQLRADQAAFGLHLAPQFKLGENWNLDIPIMIGQMGAGFYLFGDDRNTPDGRRVSVWENELMEGVDAGFSLHLEGGVRFKRQIQEHARLMLGLHYAYAPSWETFVGGTTFYNVPRISLGVEFGR